MKKVSLTKIIFIEILKLRRFKKNEDEDYILSRLSLILYLKNERINVFFELKKMY